jgi:hypothetical protein
MLKIIYANITPLWKPPCIRKDESIDCMMLDPPFFVKMDKFGIKN